MAGGRARPSPAASVGSRESSRPISSPASAASSSSGHSRAASSSGSSPASSPRTTANEATPSGPSRFAGRIHVSGRSSPMRRLAMSVRNARRSAIDRRGAVTTASHHVPSQTLRRRASADVLRRLALEQSSDEAVAVAVGRQLAGGDHPRQGRPHRAAGDAEQLADGDERSQRGASAGPTRGGSTARATGR